MSFAITLSLAPEMSPSFGKRIMAALVDHLKMAAPERAYVSLIADVPANRLYAQFGFEETAPRSLGMAMKNLW